ncbi:MAG: hypothetical protein ACJAU2_001223, partial [Maribacter sp.]
VVLSLCTHSDEEDKEDGSCCFHDLRLLHYYNGSKCVLEGGRSLNNPYYSVSDRSSVEVQNSLDKRYERQKQHIEKSGL